MKQKTRVFVIDAGNTSIKTGFFDDNELRETRRFSPADISALFDWVMEADTAQIVLSSVLSEDDTDKFFGGMAALTRITSASKVPFPIAYASPGTLGIDRLCNAAYLHQNMTSEYAVAIDIGTCIKFDIVHCKRGYLGGSIAPGIRLRYQSLNDYTGKLPLLSNKTPTALVGSDTITSIQSGVMNGMAAEIQGMIARYEDEYPDLTFFVTGGDAPGFEFHSKNNIFADENLTLRGLFEIYRHNA